MKSLPDQQPQIQTPPRRGDYLTARAKRELERRLREEGASRSEAVRLVAEHFNTPPHAPKGSSK